VLFPPRVKQIKQNPLNWLSFALRLAEIIHECRWGAKVKGALDKSGWESLLETAQMVDRGVTSERSKQDKMFIF